MQTHAACDHKQTLGGLQRCLTTNKSTVCSFRQIKFMNKVSKEGTLKKKGNKQKHLCVCRESAGSASQRHLIIPFSQSMLISPVAGILENICPTWSTHTHTHTHTHTQAPTLFMHLLIALLRCTRACKHTHTHAYSSPQRTGLMRDLYATSSLCKMSLRVIQGTNKNTRTFRESTMSLLFQLNFSCWECFFFSPLLLVSPSVSRATT